MILHVDGDSPVPPYEQIRAQVARMAVSGTLPVGARLPSIRQLAADLGIAAGTVARAYRELESDGVVASRGRLGTFVLAPGADADPSEPGVHDRLENAARAYAMETAQLGVPPATALEAASRALEQLAAI